MRSAVVSVLVILLVAPGAVAQVTFSDVTGQAGIAFTHNNGAFGKKYLPETMGAGVAFLDYDNDGWLDLFLVNGMDWPGMKPRNSFSALYRNNKDGTFSDVTRKTGLAIPFYGMGVSAADYDGDGDVDIYLSGLGPDHLFRNDDGVFKDVTSQAGLGNPSMGASSAWLDYDRDGNPDLFVANYVQWTIETDIFCTLDGTSKAYCTPESYQGSSPSLYRNLGNGTFADVTRTAGLWDETNKGLGALAFDYNNDGWTDIMLANDTQPNKLWENNRDGTFNEVGVLAGIAFSEDGVARGAMGIDAGDYDHSGKLSVVIGNFSNQMLSLFHNEGTGFFIDEAPVTEVGSASLLTLTFGCFFFDFNLDGYLDIYTANGHVENEINRVQEQVTYAQPPHLFQNIAGKRFKEVTQEVGDDFVRPRVARGAAYGDYDNDGDLDLLVAFCGDSPRLFRNDGGSRNNWVAVQLVGKESNRSGLGSWVRLKAGGLTQLAEVRASGSYCSQSQLRLTFGLANHTRIESIEVNWPSGKRQVLKNVPVNKVVTIEEADGPAVAANG
jgi:hypothetical protein